jgi:hypothetical protein
MTRVGFESTITASELAKTVHALDRAATVTGLYMPILRSKQFLNRRDLTVGWVGQEVSENNLH